VSSSLSQKQAEIELRLTLDKELRCIPTFLLPSQKYR
jgi:hypothetical protein